MRGAICQTLLHGVRLGYAPLSASQYSSYVIDERALLTSGAYLPAPPAGYPHVVAIMASEHLAARWG